MFKRIEIDQVDSVSAEILAGDLEFANLLDCQALQQAMLSHERARVRKTLERRGWGIAAPQALLVVRDLPWDSAHFGRKCADLLRLYVGMDAQQDVLDELIAQSVHDARAQGVDFFSARILAKQNMSLNSLLAAGFSLVDTSVELGQVVEQGLEQVGECMADGEHLMADGEHLSVRPARSSERVLLQQMAVTFEENRFHRDRRISKRQAEGVYRSWVDSALATDTLLAGEHDGKLAALATYSPADEGLGVATLGLVIVAPNYRGRGVFGPLLHGATRLLRRTSGVAPRAIVTSTQVSNIRALRAFMREGFRPIQARHVLHRWF